MAPRHLGQCTYYIGRYSTYAVGRLLPWLLPAFDCSLLALPSPTPCSWVGNISTGESRTAGLDTGSSIPGLSGLPVARARARDRDRRRLRVDSRYRVCHLASHHSHLVPPPHFPRHPASFSSKVLFLLLSCSVFYLLNHPAPLRFAWLLLVCLEALTYYTVLRYVLDSCIDHSCICGILDISHPQAFLYQRLITLLSVVCREIIAAYPAC
ncbi:hypothetical protein F4859DRAFT_287506 [Xylaria cf. heliscus]|nr:hypothetical protein F4859DRAFT_287506 [Xylaria cf. heliscus]